LPARLQVKSSTIVLAPYVHVGLRKHSNGIARIMNWAMLAAMPRSPPAAYWVVRVVVMYVGCIPAATGVPTVVNAPVLRSIEKIEMSLEFQLAV